MFSYFGFATQVYIEPFYSPSIHSTCIHHNRKFNPLLCHFTALMFIILNSHITSSFEGYRLSLSQTLLYPLNSTNITVSVSQHRIHFLKKKKKLKWVVIFAYMYELNKNKTWHEIFKMFEWSVELICWEAVFRSLKMNCSKYKLQEA